MYYQIRSDPDKDKENKRRKLAAKESKELSKNYTTDNLPAQPAKKSKTTKPATKKKPLQPFRKLIRD